VLLYGKGYWTFNGITWSNCYAAVYSQAITNCIWTNCTFGWIPGGTVAINQEPISGVASVNIFGESHFNKFLNCTLRDWGQIHSNGVNNYHIFGTHLSFGNETTDDRTWYNMVEGCTFYHGGHDLLETVTAFNVYRNNDFHNEPFIPTNEFCHLLYNWGTARTTENPYGAWSPRILKPGDAGTNQVDMRNVWEGNRFFYTGSPADSPGGHGIELGTRQNIYRYNSIAYALASGIFLNTSGTTSRSTSNSIYNNVIYCCGLANVFGGSNAMQGYYGMAMSNVEGRRTNNYIVNNILWSSYPKNVSASIYVDQQYRTNWNGDFVGTPDPQFISTNGLGYRYDPNNLPDFHLKPQSPCIDKGTWLAYITSANGSGTNFTLNNSLYFSDGNRIVPGDTIQLQGQTNTAVISFNDYTNNVLYFSPALAWTNGQGLSLAYSGSAPDMGAYEFIDTRTPSISVNLSALNYGPVPIDSVSNFTFTVKNNGGGTLSGTASTEAPFSIVSGSNYNLTAGQVQNVTVQYKPVFASHLSNYGLDVAETNSGIVRLTGAGETVVMATGIPTFQLPRDIIVLQADSGTIVSPLVTPNGYIYQAIQTLNTADSGRASYGFTVTNAGDYVIRAVVDAPNTGANSFFLNVDSDPQSPIMIWDIPKTSGFEKRLVGWRGNGTQDANQYIPAVFTLTPGLHQLIVLGRDNNTKLQSIEIIKIPNRVNNLRPGK
jgi:hypothetical protein